MYNHQQNADLDALFGGVGGFFAGREAAEYYRAQNADLSVRIRCGMGDICRLKGDNTQAREHYAEALRAAPDDPVTRKKLSRAI